MGIFAMELLLVVPDSAKHAAEDVFDFLIGEPLPTVPSTKVFFLDVWRVVAVENQVEFLLVRAVAAVVQQEVLI